MGNGSSTEIRGYAIESKLGAGFFGEVFKASKNGNYYAMKKLAVNQPDDKVMKEANSHKGLRHENVVQYIDSFFEENFIWIVMEYCNGGNFNSYLLKKSIENDGLISYIRQVLTGVKYLHSQSVIHRDIKPDNIMISQENYGVTLKIADFGLARVWDISVQKSEYYQFDYMPKGPRYYTASEVRNGNITNESDIFSLGCMILAMFARTTVPWGDKSLLAAVINGGEVVDASESEKRRYVEKHIALSNRGKQQKLQDLVFRMVKDKRRERPSAGEALSLMV